MKARTAAAWAFWAISVPFLMRYELHTDDTGIEVGLLLLITAILGFLHSRRAWQWALLVGPCIPLADALFGQRSGTPGFLLLAAVTTIIGLAGAYAGAITARVLFAQPSQKHQ